MNQLQHRSNKDEEFKWRLNRLKESVDAEQLLNHLGFEISRVMDKEVRAPCKVHGGDNKSSFRMNKETKNWTCFSHSCHEEVGYDVISLVEAVLGIGFVEAVKYLESITGLDIHNEVDYVEFKRNKDRNEFIKQNSKPLNPSQALVSEEYLKSFKKFRTKYFTLPENGGFSEELLDYFEIGGGYIDSYGFQREVIPIRDKNGILTAYSFRDVTGKADDDYKYILTKDFNKNNCLYNLNNAIKNMGEQRTIIVVEGFKAVWRLYTAGYKNCVACMGKRVTEGQINLLYSVAFNVGILFDADESGIEGTLKSVENMRGRVNVYPLFLPYSGKDPADCSIEEIKEVLGGLNE